MVKPLILNRPHVRCRCGKVYNPTEQEARRTYKSVKNDKGKTNPVRFYRCTDGGWHWTSQMHEVRACLNCRGQFRPRNDQPKNTETCDTCTEILKKAAAEREARLAATAHIREAARMRRAAQITAAAGATPAMFDRKRNP